MALTAIDLVAIAHAGGSLVVSGKKHIQNDLIGIAHACKVNGAYLIIKEAGQLLPINLAALAHANPGKVIFEID